MKRTKWEILEARMTKAQKAWEKASQEIIGLERTPFGGSCGSCGAVLDTEADFAKHYLVDDERYLNLGNCPTRYNNGKLMPALKGNWIDLHEVALKENKAYDDKRDADHARAHDWER
jgi:hypothetical protein